MSNGNLAKILRDKKWAIENDHVRKMALRTCQGMSYLHSRRIIHRDLKCANLLVDQDWNVKVSDFGISQILGKDREPPVMGTVAWMPPEVLSKGPFTFKSDVYSFGICLWEMTTRDAPFRKMPQTLIISEVVQFQKRPDTTKYNISTEFLNMIESCWKTDVEERPNFDQLVLYFSSMSFPETFSPTPYYSFPKKPLQNQDEIV